jgi:hypothetical protein
VRSSPSSPIAPHPDRLAANAATLTEKPSKNGNAVFLEGFSVSWYDYKQPTSGEAQMGWFKNFLRKHIVGDLPAEMERCGYCNTAKCSNGHFDACPNRLRGVRPEADTPES